MKTPPDFFEPDDETEAKALAEAEADVRAGRVVPHERVRAWLDDLAAGKRRPRPQP
jgi:predicted transcriptional regulator